MNTIISIEKGTNKVSITTIDLNRELHGLHADATARITIFNHNVNQNTSPMELLTMAGFIVDERTILLTHCTESLQPSGKMPANFEWERNYYKHDIDLNAPVALN